MNNCDPQNVRSWAALVKKHSFCVYDLLLIKATR